jgi:hypothetical protein
VYCTNVRKFLNMRDEDSFFIFRPLHSVAILADGKSDPDRQMVSKKFKNISRVCTVLHDLKLRFGVEVSRFPFRFRSVFWNSGFGGSQSGSWSHSSRSNGRRRVFGVNSSDDKLLDAMLKTSNSPLYRFRRIVWLSEWKQAVQPELFHLYLRVSST